MYDTVYVKKIPVSPVFADARNNII